MYADLLWFRTGVHGITGDQEAEESLQKEMDAVSWKDLTTEEAEDRLGRICESFRDINDRYRKLNFKVIRMPLK